jgi:hypothetical protein
MVLYVLNAKPDFFKPLNKDNAWDNFCVLIDRLIIAMGGSMCTHAALATSSPDTVVEATLPYCRYRQGIYIDGYHVIIRRVSADGKGSKVLDFVPEGINPDAKPEDNLPYAYVQSAVAALLCLFRHKAPLDPVARDAILVLLQLMLHPLAEKIDDFIAEKQGKDGAWFCSQLVTYCYDEAAKTDSDYSLHFPGLDAARDSLIDWLLGQVPDDMIRAIADPEAAKLRTTAARPTLELAGPEITHAGMKLLAAIERDADDVHAILAEGEILSLAGAAGTPALAEAASIAKDPRKAGAQILADAFHLLSALGVVESGRSAADTFREYKESLIMPSDLEGETALREVGVLYDHS